MGITLKLENLMLREILFGILISRTTVVLKITRARISTVGLSLFQVVAFKEALQNRFIDGETYTMKSIDRYKDPISTISRELELFSNRSNIIFYSEWSILKNEIDDVSVSEFTDSKLYNYTNFLYYFSRINQIINGYFFIFESDKYCLIEIDDGEVIKFES